MPSSGYSSGEMLRMQQDALRRVREMQQRANEKLMQTQPPASPAPPPPPPPVQMPPPAAPPPTANHSAHQHAPPPPKPPPKSSSPFNFLNLLFPSSGGEQNGTQQGFLARLGVDEEQAFLLVVLLMLLREGADRKLILALCYLLL